MTLVIGIPILLLGIAGVFLGGRPSKDANERTENGSKPYWLDGGGS